MSANQVHNGAPRLSPRGRSSWAALFAAPEFYRDRGESATTTFEAWFEPAVLLAAIILFCAGAIEFGLAVAPTWPVSGLLPLCGVTAVVAYLYSRRLERAVILWREWLVLLIPLLLLARVLPYVLEPGDDLGADFAGWIAEPLTFFELGFAARALLLLGTWTTAFFSTQDLDDVRVQRGELPDAPARTIIERAWESDRLRSIDHTTPFRRLVARFLQGGVALIVMAALTASNVRQLLTLDAVGQLLTLQRPSSSVALANVVAYFVAVLLLMVEAQYVRTRTLWTLDRVPIAHGIAPRWALAGAVLVGVGLVAAMLAPTESLLGLGDLVRFAIGLAFFAASYVVGAFYLLFWLLTYPLRWLLGSGSDEAPSAPAFQAPPAPAPAADGSLLDVVKSALFWAIFAAVVGYSLVALYRQGTVHRMFPGIAKVGEVAATLLRAFGLWLGRLLRLVTRQAAAVIRAVLPLGGTPRSSGAGPGWLRDLLPGGDPRRVVIAMYQLVAARAAQRGLARSPGQTAAEYRARLAEALPDAAGDLEDLTNAFQRARYSNRPIGDADAGLARRCWRRIRAYLQSAPRRAAPAHRSDL